MAAPIERKPVGWRAREWRRMLDEGVCLRPRSREGVTTAAVSIALRKLRGRARIYP